MARDGSTRGDGRNGGRRARREVHTHEHRHRPRRNDRRGPGLQRFRLLGRERLTRAQLEQRASGHPKLRAPGTRPGCPHRQWLVALDPLQHSGRHAFTPRRRRRCAEEPAARRRDSGPHRLRQRRIWGPVSAAGQAAPLLLPAVRIESAEARFATGCDRGVRGVQRPHSVPRQRRTHGTLWPLAARASDARRCGRGWSCRWSCSWRSMRSTVSISDPGNSPRRPAAYRPLPARVAEGASGAARAARLA